MPTVKDFRRFSQNYQVSKTMTVPWSQDPFTAKLEGNLLFDPSSYIAKEAMLKTTLELFGLRPLDVFEVQQLLDAFLLLSSCLFFFFLLLTNIVIKVLCYLPFNLNTVLELKALKTGYSFESQLYIKIVSNRYRGSVHFTSSKYTHGFSNQLE